MSRYINVDDLKADMIIEKRDFMSCGVTLDYASVRGVTMAQILTAPSIDIVRCQDCKHWVYNFNGCSRNPCTEPWYATDFCNYGEREGE